MHRQGGSEGTPRYLEDLAAKASDASAISDCLQKLDYVDAKRIGLVGICAGDGYAITAASMGHGLVSRAPETDISEIPATSLPTPDESRPRVPWANAAHAQALNESTSGGKYRELSRGLLEAWPSPADLNLIADLPSGLSTPVFWGICTPYPCFIDRGPPSPRDMLQLPPPGSHPVLIARKLLILGTFLQGVPPSSMQSLNDHGVCYRGIMNRAIEQAIRVTTNDELICSVEGIECVMMEAMYQNYAGNLHRAYMAVHRAIAASQMIGLPRGRNSPCLKFIEASTRATFDPGHICFRLVQMDRYLSLMLGLPHTSLEARFAIPDAVEGVHSINRLDRIHCAVVERILQRNKEDMNDLSETSEVDKLLQSAAAEMPPGWWLSPTFANETELLEDTIRLMQQFTQYHLLARLHLPYMLRSSPDRRYDHSKIIAVNASRDILSRYVVFRTSNPAHFYCRGCDFLAFVATTIMCIAHIDSHSQSQKDGPALNFLAHTRPSDRGTMQRTCEIIQILARASTTDAIASKLARIIQHLLDVEASAATGTIYSTSSSTGSEGEFEGSLTQGGNALHIQIPYYGTITFERGLISKSAPSQDRERNNTWLPSQLGDNQHHLSGSHAHGEIGNVDVDFQPDLFLSSLDEPSTFNTEPAHSNQTWAPDAEDNWDLQGIDIALFDSLFRGIDLPKGPLNEQRTCLIRISFSVSATVVLKYRCSYTSLRLHSLHVPESIILAILAGQDTADEL
ncbi:hypothetical protein BJX99DRAFT_253208 [Aspergillus californicus]